MFSMKAVLLCLLIATFAVPAEGDVVVDTRESLCYWSECYFVGMTNRYTNYCKKGFIYIKRKKCEEYRFRYDKQHCCPILEK
uniref:BPTI/Kunitz inhibitor domain-containing protein n=1 Tax=Steinernema glaseri TaxID=37863 RepID=A0A1I7Y129_9BILA